MTEDAVDTARIHSSVTSRRRRGVFRPLDLARHVPQTQRMRHLTEDDEVDALADNLQREFSDVAPTLNEVRREVRGVRDHYRDARVRQFVPVLVYRETRETLRRRRATVPYPSSGP